MDIKPDLELDLRGLKCPMPMVRTSLAIKHMETGQVLRAVASNPASMKDIPAWARVSGNEMLLAEEKDGTFPYVVRKSS